MKSFAALCRFHPVVVAHGPRDIEHEGHFGVTDFLLRAAGGRHLEFIEADIAQELRLDHGVQPDLDGAVPGDPFDLHVVGRDVGGEVRLAEIVQDHRLGVERVVLVRSGQGRAVEGLLQAGALHLGAHQVDADAAHGHHDEKQEQHECEHHPVFLSCEITQELTQLVLVPVQLELDTGLELRLAIHRSTLARLAFMAP